MKKPNNVVDLMQIIFNEICLTAIKRTPDKDQDGLIVSLESGPNEGQAIRLCRDHTGVSIEFHSNIISAKDVNHHTNAWYKFILNLHPSGVTDLKLGTLFNASFFTSNEDIVRLTSHSRKLLPFVIGFHSLIEDLPSYYIWETQLNAEWAMVIPEQPIFSKRQIVA